MALHPGYNKIDPDTIHQGSRQKITFFYLPWSDDLLYDEDGDKTHQDMLHPDEDDQDDDYIFDLVYPDKKNLNFQQREPFRSRGAALRHTNAILGRFGMLNNEMVVALWNPLTDPNVPKCIKRLYKGFPQLAQMEVILVGGDKKARVMKPPAVAARGVKEPRPKKLMPNTVKGDVDGTFYIDGTPYSYDELRRMRLSTHAAPTYADKERARAILCHPDMAKYPELAGLRPSNCRGGEVKPPEPGAKPSRQSMRDRWAQASGMPLLFKYGESFRDFLSDNP